MRQNKWAGHDPLYSRMSCTCHVSPMSGGGGRVSFCRNQDWEIRTNLFRTTVCLSATMNSASALIWWQMGDVFPEIMLACETMCKLICRASDLKCGGQLFV